MEEDGENSLSNNPSCSNSAKRSKLDNMTLEDETDTSMSNDNNFEMTDNNPTTSTANIEGEKNENIPAPVEDSGFSGDTKATNGARTSPNTSMHDSSSSTSSIKSVSRLRAGVKRNRHANRNYRSQIFSSSSSSEEDDVNVVIAANAERRDSDSSCDSSSLEELSPPITPPIRNTGEASDSDSSAFTFDYPDAYDSNDSNTSHDESCESAPATQILSKPKPAYNYSFVQEMMYREQGLAGKGRTSIVGRNQIAFQERVYGARHTVEKMQLLHTLKKHEGCVNSLNFNKSGELLVTGSDDLKIIIWKWATKDVVHIFDSGHNSNVFQTKFIDLGGGINIISSARDGQLRHSTIPSCGGKPVSTILIKHQNSVHKIALSSQNPYEILTASEDGHVVRCDLRENKVERAVTVKHRKRKVPLYSIAHHPFDPEFCVCGRDQYVRVYDKRNTKKPIYMMCPQHMEDKKPFGRHITCAVYNHNGTEILASYSEDDIYLFNNKCYLPGQFTHRYTGHNNYKTIKGVNFFGLNSEYVVSGSDCGNFFFWDKNNESIVNWIKGDDLGAINCLEPHPTFPILATSGLEHDVKIWVPSREKVPPAMEGLEKYIKHNSKRFVMPDNDLVDDRTFYFFVRQCLRNRRSGQAEGTPNYPNVSDLISSDSGDDDGCSEDEHTRYRSLPCTPQ